MRVSQLLIFVPVLALVVVSLTVLGADVLQRKSEHSGLLLARRLQFELPVFFLSGCLFAYAVRRVDEWVLAAALAFVVAHFVQTFMAVASDNGKRSDVAELAAFVAVAMLWLTVAIGLLASGF